MPSQCQDVGGWMEGWVEGRMEGKKEGWTDVDKPLYRHFPSPKLTYETSYTQKSLQALKSVILNQGQFLPQETLAMSGDISDCHSFWGGALLLASRGLRPRYVTHLRCTGQPTTEKDPECHAQAENSCPV